MGCGAARSLLLFGYVLVLCSEPLDYHFISFFCLRIVVAAGSQVIEVHHWCCLGGLLGGFGVWRGGSGGHISKRGFGLGWSCCFVSFYFLCIAATTGDHAIEVYRCCYPGGLLGGLFAVSRGEGWGHLFFQLCMCSWSNREEACYINGGGYLEEGFQGGTL